VNPLFLIGQYSARVPLNTLETVFLRGAMFPPQSRPSSCNPPFFPDSRSGWHAGPAHLFSSEFFFLHTYLGGKGGFPMDDWLKAWSQASLMFRPPFLLEVRRFIRARSQEIRFCFFSFWSFPLFFFVSQSCKGQDSEVLSVFGLIALDALFAKRPPPASSSVHRCCSAMSTIFLRTTRS